jgi:hypothetical protein
MTCIFFFIDFSLDPVWEKKKKTKPRVFGPFSLGHRGCASLPGCCVRCAPVCAGSLSGDSGRVLQSGEGDVILSRLCGILGEGLEWRGGVVRPAPP